VDLISPDQYNRFGRQDDCRIVRYWHNHTHHYLCQTHHITDTLITLIQINLMWLIKLNCLKLNCLKLNCLKLNCLKLNCLKLNCLKLTLYLITLHRHIHHSSDYLHTHSVQALHTPLILVSYHHHMYLAHRSDHR